MEENLLFAATCPTFSGTPHRHSRFAAVLRKTAARGTSLSLPSASQTIACSLQAKPTIRDVCDATILYRVEDKDEGKDAEHADEFHVLYNTFDPARGMARIPCLRQQSLFYQLDSPGIFAGRNVQAQDVIPKVARLFRERLLNIFFFNPSPSAMRGYVPAGDEELKEDGFNLSFQCSCKTV